MLLVACWGLGVVRSGLGRGHVRRHGPPPSSWSTRATIRSTQPHARLDAIELDDAFDWKRVVVVTADDIPGENVVSLIDDDQPCLAEHEVYHVAEPILLLAHADRERLAAASVHIDYTPQPALFDPERSTRSFKTITIAKGSVEQAFAGAEVVIEGEYRTGHQEQLYIEPNGVIAKCPSKYQAKDGPAS